LICGTVEADEVVRITWTHAFVAYAPFAVRAERLGQTYRVSTGVFEPSIDRARRSGFSSSSRSSQGGRTLGQAEWRELTTQLDKAEFWMMPTDDHALGFDGSGWLLERRRGSAYHMVYRWSPPNGPFRDAALALIRLGGFEDPEPR
jgi:hypothetical protein